MAQVGHRDEETTLAPPPAKLWLRLQLLVPCDARGPVPHSQPPFYLPHPILFVYTYVPPPKTWMVGGDKKLGVGGAGCFNKHLLSSVPGNQLQ